ncbi:MAG: DUF1565 domain-containing protein, partial [Candidatus Moranbacteria bacterium]|nr:DUF1565 domain-containing protein [Candidatus Moranbacteria bacterium]
MNIISIRKREVVVSAILLAVLILPFFSFAGTSKIYVNDGASGTQNGSINHPYKTITKALEKANDDDEIHIASGTYKE